MVRQLPAAQQLSIEVVAGQLQAAVCGNRAIGDGGFVHELCKLPAARQLSSAAIVQLLHATSAWGEVTATLCRLPGAAGISTAAMFQLLQAAVLRDDCRSIHTLCAVPAAAVLSSEEVAALLNTAATHGAAQVTRVLLIALPSVQPAAAKEYRRSRRCTARVGEHYSKPRARLASNCCRSAIADDDDWAL